MVAKRQMLLLGQVLQVRLAIFDFDGTLTTKDSLNEFLKYSVSKPTYYINMLIFAPLFVLYKLKILDNSYTKEKLFKLFFDNMDENEFKTLAQNFSKQKIPTIIRDEIYTKFKQHIKEGNRVIVVSASIECYLMPWTKQENVELLSTQLLFENGRFKGKFLTKNCHGIEKLKRINAHLDTTKYKEIFAYGDSDSGDKYIWKIADHKIKVK